MFDTENNFAAETGANEPGVAEPVTEVNTEPTVEDGGANEPEPAKPAQSDEDNAKYAEARRKAEEEAKMKREAMDQRFREQFSGYTNPLTGKPIDGVESYLEALEAQKQYQMQEELRQKGVDPELINQAIQNSPLIKQAEELLNKQREAEQQKMIEAELQEIYALDPTIKNPDDLIKMDNFEQFRGYVQKGYSFADSFKLANFAKLQQVNTDAAKQAAINQARSISHMESTSGVAEQRNDLIPIPENVLGKWKESYPNMTLAELTAKYNAAL